MATTIITEAQICDAMAATFRAIPNLVVQSYNQLSDGIVEMPLLQIYWQSFIEDSLSDSDRSAAQRKVIIADDTFQLDLYAKTRSELSEDIAVVMDYVAKIRAIMYTQTTSYFGLSEIKSIRWQAQRTTLRYGDPIVRYAGARFTIVTRIF